MSIDAFMLLSVTGCPFGFGVISGLQPGEVLVINSSL